jgi:predicted Zn finger-like uncharacterized protein
MLKVECESCKAPYQIDERRVPKGGLKMRCPKCGHSFVVQNPNEPAAAAPPPAAPAAPAGPQRIPSFTGALDGIDLPALASDAGLPAPAKGAPAKRPAPIAKPVAAPPPAPAAAAAAPSAPPVPSFDGFGSVEDDLPALPGFGDVGGFGEIDFPMAKPAAAPAPFPAAPKPQFGDVREPTGVGLPAPVARPAPSFPKAAPVAPAPPPPAPSAPPAFGDIGDVVGLPAALGPAAGLPMPKAAPPPAAAPAPHAGGFGDVGGFGDIGLPAVHGGGAGLPSVGGGGAGLPSVAGGGAGLPSVAGGGAGLPAVHGGGGGGGGDFGFGELDLPSLMSDLPGLGGAGLPMPGGAGLPMPGGAGLPMPGGAGLPMPGGAGLPMATGPGGYLPATADQQGLLPGQSNLPSASQGNYLPSMAQGQGLLPSQSNLPMPMGGFGDIDLPVPQQSLGSGFGDLDIGGGSAGGVGFGEVDLGGGGGGGDMSSDALLPGASGPRPAVSGGFGADPANPSVPPPRARPTRSAQGGGSKAPRIIAGLLALFVIGGAALQATPYGAFGYLAISDALHSSEYKKTTQQAATQARASLAKDVYGDARKVASDLVATQAKNPRARQLAAYAALTEYAVELRFGIVTEHAAKASYLLGTIPPKTDVPYLSAAQGAREAVAGKYDEARALLDAAAKKDPNDPVQDDIRFVRGELELAAKNADAAISAFSAAGQGASPRAHFGLARAYLLKKDRAKAEAEVEATLKGSPEHVGALLARARLAWSLHRDEAASLKDLSVIVDGVAKPNASPGELSQAYSLRGWVMLTANRASDARTAFEEARKLDARNTSALIGEGELLYADGRYTEAISRFEEAVQKSPDDVDAVCGAAKTKIALERLQDAKTQLTAARSTFKSEMAVALWLGKAEDALGNKSVAESEYNVAIALADPALPNAVEPYAALAKLLAAQGRTTEALQKLELAKSKLVDTPALQRAFGDVLAAQGKFDDAIGHYQKALAKNENDIATHFRLGQAYRKMRKMDLASASLEKVAAVDKEYPGLALERGMLFEESGDVQKALDQFQGALAKAPTDLDLMLRVGAAYVVIGQTEEGVKMLTKVFEQRPNSAEANHFLGRAYLRQGGLQTTAAMPRLRRAAELDPNRAEYHLYVAWAANEAAQPDVGLARKEIDRALELDSTLADAYWQRGIVNFKQAAVKDAEKDLRKALELKPNRIEAHATLAEILQHGNNDAAALSEWAIATTAIPKNAYWRYRYGSLLLEKGKSAEAVGHLTFALTEGGLQAPRPGWLYQAAFAAAEAQRKTGKKTEAIESYKRFLELAPSSSPDRADAIRALKQLGGPVPE